MVLPICQCRGGQRSSFCQLSKHAYSNTWEPTRTRFCPSLPLHQHHVLRQMHLKYYNISKYTGNYTARSVQKHSYAPPPNHPTKKTLPNTSHQNSPPKSSNHSLFIYEHHLHMRWKGTTKWHAIQAAPAAAPRNSQTIYLDGSIRCPS